MIDLVSPGTIDSSDSISPSVQKPGPVGDDLKLDLGLIGCSLDEKALSVRAHRVVVVSGALDPIDLEKLPWKADLGAAGVAPYIDGHQEIRGGDEEQFLTVGSPLGLASAVQRDAHPLTFP